MGTNQLLTKLYVKSVITLKGLKDDQRGVTAIEYALVAVAIAAVVAVAFATTGTGTLGGALKSAMENVAGQVTAASGDG